MKTAVRHSIRFKIILIFSIITALIVLVMARLAYDSAKSIYLRQLAEQTTRLSRIIAAQLDIRFLDFIDPETESAGAAHYQAKLRAISKRLSLNNVFLFNQKGTVLAEANQLTDAQAGLRLYQTQLNRLPINETFHSLPFKAADGQWYFWNYLRLNKHYFLGVRERSALLAELDDLSRLFWGIGILGVFLVLLAAWFIGRSITRPIDKLIAFSTDIGNGKMQSRVPESVRGELALLKDALLNMRNNLNAHQQEKENMLAQIAHELRNPLGGIALLAGLIKEDPAISESNKSYAQSIADETEKLKHQIGAYLHYSRPPQAQTQSIDLHTFFNEIGTEFKLRPETSQIHLNIDIQDRHIQFDPAHLQQIIRNLLDNSVRACGTTGTIEIRSSGQEIAIRDDGSGISEDLIEKIFEPFFTTDPEGTGLGLAVCRRLCRENNADLLVINNPDKGCTFTIRKQKSPKEVV